MAEEKNVELWNFKYTVREEKYAENVEYKGELYNNFEECYTAFARFNPQQHWANLQEIVEILIWRVGHRRVNIGFGLNLLVLDDTALELLGTTRHAFRNIARTL